MIPLSDQDIFQCCYQLLASLCSNLQPWLRIRPACSVFLLLSAWSHAYYIYPKHAHTVQSACLNLEHVQQPLQVDQYCWVLPVTSIKNGPLKILNTIRATTYTWIGGVGMSEGWWMWIAIPKRWPSWPISHCRSWQPHGRGTWNLTCYLTWYNICEESSTCGGDMQHYCLFSLTSETTELSQ